MIQSLTIKPLAWIYRVDLERGALGAVGRDRIASPDNALPLQSAFGSLADAGARRRGEALPAVLVVDGRGWALVVATSPTTTRITLEVSAKEWLALFLMGAPQVGDGDNNATRVWRHLTTREVVVEADANGRTHPQWARLQRISWDDCESQEAAA